MSPSELIPEVQKDPTHTFLKSGTLLKEYGFRERHPEAWKNIKVTLVVGAILALLVTAGILAIHFTGGLHNFTQWVTQTKITAAEGILYIALPSIALVSALILFGKYAIPAIRGKEEASPLIIEASPLIIYDDNDVLLPFDDPV